MKTVVVASGKGGTGKTTLSAVFARVASDRLAVVVADGDVEASNLPLALHTTGVSCTPFSGGARAAIRPEACTECDVCTQLCRFDAVGRDTTGAYVVDEFACEGCGRCAASCPSGAIDMLPARAGEACTGSCSVGPIAFGQLGPGEDLSGRLVTEVRRRATEAAEEHAADLVLVDGPPGVGCPLISAVANADVLVAVAEPTVSGEHDLGRLVDLAGQLEVPVRVVLNKADLSAEGARRVRELCEARNLPLVGEVSFDTALADLGAVYDVDGAADSVGLREAIEAWRSVESELRQ